MSWDLEFETKPFTKQIAVAQSASSIVELRDSNDETADWNWVHVTTSGNARYSVTPSSNYSGDAVLYTETLQPSSANSTNGPGAGGLSMFGGESFPIRWSRKPGINAVVIHNHGDNAAEVIFLVNYGNTVRYNPRRDIHVGT